MLKNIMDITTTILEPSFFVFSHILILFQHFHTPPIQLLDPNKILITWAWIWSPLFPQVKIIKLLSIPKKILKSFHKNWSKSNHIYNFINCEKTLVNDFIPFFFYFYKRKYIHPIRLIYPLLCIKLYI